MKKILSDQNGITLLEVILVIVLLTIVSTVIYASYFDGLRVWVFNKDRVEIQRAQDLVYTWLSNNIYTEDITAINIPNDQKIVFSNGDSVYLENDYLYIELNSLAPRKITDLAFEEITFSKIPVSGANYISFDAVIFNRDQSKTYKFNNVFYPRVQ
jgi:prepilin-type N-terminal cleavage/methylation domain-containing protein